jgi:hypothetical protein
MFLQVGIWVRAELCALHKLTEYSISAAPSIICRAITVLPAAIPNLPKYLDGFDCHFVSRCFLISEGSFQPILRQIWIAQRTAEAILFQQQLISQFLIVTSSGLI